MARRTCCSVRPSVAALLACLLLTAVAERPAGGEGVVHRPPVDGTPVDGFRPPAHPFGSGNRGLEYHPPLGTPVRATADGEVVFAGPVAGALHVTVRHADGLRTSYSFLASVEVAVGATVSQGAVLGTSTAVLHLGMRVGETYVDPQAVFDGGHPHLRLVPEPVRQVATAEAAGLLPVVLDALRGDRWATARHYLGEVDLDRRLARVAGRVTTTWLSDEPCSPPSTAPPPVSGPRVAVLVGGFGSTSDSASVDRVDTGALGYQAADVVRFSYAGGRTPGRPPGGPLTAIDGQAHGADASQGDLVAGAGRLRAVLSDVAQARPGVPIDVYAHSQGGVLVQIALTDVADGPSLPEAVDLVATLGSPHTGTDLATAVAALADAPHGPAGLAAIEAQLATGLDPDAPAVAQLSEVSPLLADLRREPAPRGVRLLTIGARGDLTVPAIHTRLWDSPHHVIDLAGPDAHSDLVDDPATTRELALALAGHPPTCASAIDVLADEAVPEGISFVEDTLGAAALALGWAPGG